MQVNEELCYSHQRLMYGCGFCIRLLLVAFIFLVKVCQLTEWERQCMRRWGNERQQCSATCYSEVWAGDTGRRQHRPAHTLPWPSTYQAGFPPAEEVNLKNLSEEYVQLVISGCSAGESYLETIGSTATSISKQLSSTTLLKKKILPTTTQKTPSTLCGITPALFLSPTVHHFSSLISNGVDSVRAGSPHYCHDNSPEAYHQEQMKTTSSCYQHCMQSYVQKTLKTSNLYEFELVSTQNVLNKNNIKNKFLEKDNSLMLQVFGLGTDILVIPYCSQNFTDKISMLPSITSICSSADEVYTNEKAWILDILYNKDFHTPVIHEGTESLLESMKGNMEVNALYYTIGDQCILDLGFSKEQLANVTGIYKIRPKQSTNLFSKKIHTSNILYTTSPVNNEVLEFRTRYIKVSPDPVTDTKVMQDKHCRTCKTANFMETNIGSKPRKIMTTSTSLYFPEPVTRSVSLLDLPKGNNIKKVINDSTTTNKVIHLTEPPEIIPEPSTKFIGTSDIVLHSFDSDALISVFVDYSSIWTTHQILSSASPSPFSKPKTFLWYQTDIKSYDPKVPESVTLESSLRSFPDVTLGNIEKHTPMTRSWEQHFAS